ncbi:MAG: hypothetical protein ACK5IQ_09175 [Bacteroidales bacterium]
MKRAKVRTSLLGAGDEAISHNKEQIVRLTLAMEDDNKQQKHKAYSLQLIAKNKHMKRAMRQVSHKSMIILARYMWQLKNKI